MTYLTIDRLDVMYLFDRLVQPDSEHRTLHLLGDAKMGKTHLMTRIFPQRAEAHNCRYAVQSLHGQIRVADILHTLRSKLAELGPFAGFDQAYRDWATRPVIEASDIQALFAKISVTAQKGEDESRKVEPMLTTHFVADLRQLNAGPVVLLFDALDNAPDSIKTWLFCTLLGQLALLPHVRVVVAGRSLPDPGEDYAPRCRVHRLQPVWDVQEYITYCQHHKVGLVEQSIRDFARAIDYRPGQFVGLVEAFREA